MTAQPFRTPEGGLINRDQPMSFTFNGKKLHAYEGDTLASALLANGEKLVARSFKYHRPRGIFSAGPEEPSALMRIGSGACAEPNTRATQVLLRDGMRVCSQNHWPSLSFDLLSIINRLSPFLSAGFYNKTFMWPRRFWPLYETLLRNIAGLGRAPGEPDADRYEQRYAHCDVLVVGAGPAGLVAAKTLADAGARTILVNEAEQVGGWLLWEQLSIAGNSGQDWSRRMHRELDANDNVEVLSQTTAFAYYDHNLVTLCERLPSGNRTDQPAQRMCRLRAKQVILATGSIERPLIFANNDLPGVMLAGAARAYLHQYGVRAGRRAVIYANNNSAYRSAVDLHDAGVEVVAVVDTRPAPDEDCVALLTDRSIRLYSASYLSAQGTKSLHSVTLYGHGSTTAVKLTCDLLCVSGGWTPSVHLHSQSGGKCRFDEKLNAFVAGAAKQQSVAAGAICGEHSLEGCLQGGHQAALKVARLLSIDIDQTETWNDAALIATEVAVPDAQSPDTAAPPPGRAHNGKQFVDLQNDVTIKDIRQAHLENYVSVEHLKRYTTLGMGTDQGKTSNLNGLTLLAELREEPIPRVGTTTFRPPYTPITLGVLAGRLTDDNLAPTRKTVLHAQHESSGAIFDFNGLWLRPQCYLHHGESVDDAIQREALAVRENAGITDISTLGKFEIQGADCIEFLNRVYVNAWKKLAVGRARYGLMLRDDGMVLDDGTVTRLGENHYFITTSSGHAEHVLQHLEYLLDVAWTNLDVNLVPVTEQWAGIALAGPKSRELLTQLLGSSGTGANAIPYMGYADAELQCGEDLIPARVIRISFSGELAHEIYVPGRCGPVLWEWLIEHGESVGLIPFGMDAMDVLRIEKGFIVVGADADGRTTPQDIGFGKMVSQAKRCIGWHGLTRPALHEPGRLQLVGLRAVSDRTRLREGAQLISQPGDLGFDASIGHISSAGFSPLLDQAVALALVADGHSRTGETIYSVDPARGAAEAVAVEIIPPCVYDTDGSRMRV